MTTPITPLPCLVRSRSALRGLALGALLFGSWSVAADASTVVRRSLSERVERAQLIAEGVVVSIDHRTSDVVAPGDQSVPYTFVTFSIERIVKGAHDGGETLTLRFLGGPDGSGRTMHVAGLPSFEIGDREILFVRDGSTVCPLVSWGQGRLRVVRDEIFDDAGFRVWITPEGRLARGDKRIDVEQAGYPLRAPDQASHEPRSKFAPPAGSALPDGAGMIAVLREMTRAQRASGGTSSPEIVKSARIGDRFRGPSFTRSRPAGGSPKRRGQ